MGRERGKEPDEGDLSLNERPLSSTIRAAYFLGGNVRPSRKERGRIKKSS